MQVVLHAGMHKTGTTSFQHWLREQSRPLARSGFATFPLDTRVIASSPKLFDPEGLRTELHRARKSGVTTAVFSHETLCQLKTSGYARLAEVFDGLPVRY